MWLKLDLGKLETLLKKRLSGYKAPSQLDVEIANSTGSPEG